MIVVSDTSAISNLLLIGEIDILRITFSRIVIPDSVYEELCKIETHLKALEDLIWIENRSLSDRVLFDKLRKDLDIGESEAIALAIELNADILLIDEARGRAVAESLGLEITGILGVLVRAKEAGHISEIRPYVDRLRYDAEFWMSDKVIETVLALAGEK